MAARNRDPHNASSGANKKRHPPLKHTHISASPLDILLVAAALFSDHSGCQSYLGLTGTSPYLILTAQTQSY